MVGFNNPVVRLNLLSLVWSMFAVVENNKPSLRGGNVAGNGNLAPNFHFLHYFI